MYRYMSIVDDVSSARVSVAVNAFTSVTGTIGRIIRMVKSIPTIRFIIPVLCSFFAFVI